MLEHYHYLQQLINGLTIGSTYALIAIGYTMVYGIIGMINFAHGEVYMIGSYVAFIVIAGMTMFGLDSVPLLVTCAFAAAIIVTSAYGYSIERVAYRPLRGSNRLIPLISAIGMSIFLQNEVLLAQGSKNMAIPSLITGNVVIGADEATANDWLQRLDFRPLRDLYVILQEDRHADRRDQRRQSERSSQRAIGNALNGPAIKSGQHH